MVLYMKNNATLGVYTPKSAVFPAPNTQGATMHRLLRRKEVEQTLGISRSSIYARLDADSPQYDPSFPKQLQLGAKTVVWLESEIQSWIAARIAARQAGV